MTSVPSIPYELVGGPRDGAVEYLPHRTKFYISFGGYRHYIYIAKSDPFQLSYIGSAATRELAESLANAETQ